MKSGDYLAGIDVGDRRIGISIASKIAKIASPYTTIDRKVVDIEAWMTSFIQNEDIGLLVIGLPRDINSNETEQTKSTSDFVERLKKSLEIPIVTIDEAVSSVEAEERLKNRGKSYTKSDIDSEAATVILEDYLRLNF